MLKERRQLERSDTYIITEFRPFNGSQLSSEGITSNLTQDGFNFESEDFNLPFRKVLEFNLKHPRNHLSFSARGTVVWKKDGWYKCTSGIKFTDLDVKAKVTINEIISGRGESFDKSTDTLPDAESRKPLDTVSDSISDLIMEEDKLLERKEWYHAFSNLSSDSMLLIDAAPDDVPVIIDANKAACSMYGYTIEEMIGKPITLLEVPESRKYSQDTLRGLKPGEPLSFETRHIHKNGSHFPVAESAELINFGGVSYIVVTEKDITYREQQDDCLDELTEEFNEMSRKLQNEINERQCLEESMKSTDKRYQELFDSIQSGAIVSGGIKKHSPDTEEETIHNGSLHLKSQDRQKQDFIPITLVISVIVLTALVLTFDNINKTPESPASENNSVEQLIPLINNAQSDGVPVNILFNPLENYASFDISRIELPKPEQFIIPKKEKDLQNKPVKIALPKPIIRSKHPLEVFADSHKGDFTSYEERFDDNKNDWYIFDTGEASASIVSSAYQIDNKTDSIPLFILHHHDFPHDADFIIEAFIMPVKHSEHYSYGFLLGAKDAQNSYAFQIGSYNVYSIKSFSDGIEQIVADGKVRTGVVNRDSVNILKIIKQDSEVSFYINDVFLDILANVDFYGNKVGFIVEGITKIAIEKEQSRIKQKTSLAGK